MEETLRLLYMLQTVDSNLDELNEMKGDLPQAVDTLQSEIDTLDAEIKNKQDLITSTVMARDKADVDILEFKEKLEKYKAQQFQVRNNKEYDALTKEIEFAEESIKSLQKQFDMLEGTMTATKSEIVALTEKLDELQKSLDEKKSELDEVTKANEEEELKLTHQREKVIVRLSASHIEHYERVRKARNGKAVVTVRRDSCGGCHNKIPPQRLLELRTMKKLYTCEHCGRIVVANEIAKNDVSVL